MNDPAMLDLFRMEAEAQAHVLAGGLLALERDRTAAPQLELCMRAAHSLKGAARIVGLDPGVRLAHAMEDCFVAAQGERITLVQAHIDQLLLATDLLIDIANTPEDRLGEWTAEGSRLAACIAALERMLAPHAGQADAPEPVPASPDRDVRAVTPLPASTAAPAPEPGDRVLRVTAENLNTLLGLASESLVESRWMKPFSASLLRLKRMQQEVVRTIEAVRQREAVAADERANAATADALRRALECQALLGRQLEELELFDRRSHRVAQRLYEEALACRMRPFSDSVQAFPRMVRDLAQKLGKQVALEIAGGATHVDRDVLVKLDAPLGHLLRNAIDHGIESPDRRRAAGKPVEGLIRLEARHSAGALQVIIADDGAGIDVERIRRVVVDRRLLSDTAAAKLTDAELLEFLFLPGFTMKESVTDVSGRGVGLDAVQDMAKAVRGIVRVSSELGEGTRFVLQLPVTLSVVRALLADVAGEPYAFPLASIVRTLKLPTDRIDLLEGRQHFEFEGRRIGLVAAHQVLGTEEPPTVLTELPVIVLGDHHRAYGLVVERFLGERELVVHPLDPQLGKIKDISSGALMEDGSPVLIVDADDLLRSLDRLASDGQVHRVRAGAETQETRRRKRVLVVDDSLTVRELERKLLAAHGYQVEVAVDGMDGWNAVRMGDFDLVVTDIDMPRMDGIELVKLINADPTLQSRPVMVVSYKDRDEDRRRGLEAGAAYYLTKGSFQDDTFVRAVVDLIGEAVA